MFAAAMGLLALGIIIFSIGMTAARNVSEEKKRLAHPKIGAKNVGTGNNNRDYPNEMALAAKGTQNVQGDVMSGQRTGA